MKGKEKVKIRKEKETKMLTDGQKFRIEKEQNMLLRASTRSKLMFDDKIEKK